MRNRSTLASPSFFREILAEIHQRKQAIVRAVQQAADSAADRGSEESRSENGFSCAVVRCLFAFGRGTIRGKGFFFDFIHGFQKRMIVMEIDGDGMR